VDFGDVDMQRAQEVVQRGREPCHGH
jgi:hypothetical protein